MALREPHLGCSWIEHRLFAVEEQQVPGADGHLALPIVEWALAVQLDHRGVVEDRVDPRGQRRIQRQLEPTPHHTMMPQRAAHANRRRARCAPVTSGR